MIGKQNQDPSQLSRKYIRRAKAAAWASGIPGIFGGVVGAEAIRAQPAAAMQEAAPRLEKDPQAFIDSFDKKLEREVRLMRSSPNFTSKRQGQVSKDFHTEIRFDYVGAPSRQYPGRYDWVAVVMRENVPLLVEVLLGSDSKTYVERINPRVSYLFGQGDSTLKRLPKSMSLLTGAGGDPSPDTYFNVSSEGYPAPILPEDGVKYSDHPAKVSDVYRDFLKQIHSIVTRE